MIQDYCKKFMKRDQMFETCGRVLRTDGGCDNEHKHATLYLEGAPVPNEQTGSGK